MGGSGSTIAYRAGRAGTVAALLLALANAAPAAEAPPLAILDARIVDVVRGRASPPRTVLIVSGRITAIGATAALGIPRHATRVDARGRYLVPGLVDMHVHLFNIPSGRAPSDWALPLFVGNGVTSVREMAANEASLDVVRRWREETAQGTRIAPRIVAVGIPVRGEDADGIVDAVRSARAAGADFVKVFSQFPGPRFAATVAAARAQGLPVDGHAPADLRAVDAATAGLRINEHLMQLYEACSPLEPSMLAERAAAGAGAAEVRDRQESRILAHYDAAACRETARAIARTGQPQVPTLVLLRPNRGASAAHYRSDPHWPLLRGDEQLRWARIIDAGAPVDANAYLRHWQVARRIVGALHAAGVPILAGTDAPMPLVYPGYSLHDELELLVESGLSPADALRAATIGPSRVLGLEAEQGTVSVGKRADLVLLDADPLEDIEHTRRIHAVVLDGRLLPREQLDALLATGPRASAGD
ncbi:MAG TPA: amidohydrolase family protein [Xanthomonadales bacterium]|nr:amidohydrolase family protein [Xanthomonadales bacterium]